MLDETPIIKETITIIDLEKDVREEHGLFIETPIIKGSIFPKPVKTITVFVESTQS